ncbi:hypothetical protein G9P44_005537 [Scheffersomyces stipitis]|nr:hypothetical protein G9P44_005537 [Scheffersomyces stipitis]
MSLHSQNVKLLLTEDLSPHKIATLLLVQLYCEQYVHSSLIRPILRAIIKFIENEPIYDSNGSLVVLPTMADFCYWLEQEVIGNAVHHNVQKEQQDHNKHQEDQEENEIQDENQMQDENQCKDEEVKVNIDDSKLLHLRQLEKELLNKLWSINSVESLDQSITACFVYPLSPTAVSVKDVYGHKRLSSRSLLGRFIHKITTSFRLLKFDEVFLLYEAFVEYRSSSRSKYLNFGGSSSDSLHSTKIQSNIQDSDLYNKLNAQLKENIGFDIPTTAQSIVDCNKRLLLVPKHDLQTLLERQIHLLETYGTPTPQILKDIMYIMTSPNSNTSSIQNINFNHLPSHYYIKYLEALHGCDYLGAFEALHQYFDYMVSNNSKYFYHFALISRASLHQFFGEDEKAIDAIEEAISVARENKDNATLTYILSWLFNFMKNKPQLWNRQSFYNNNNESQLLDFLIKKSQSVSLSLYSMSYNFETLQIMNNGGSMTSYLESLLKASYISINDEIPSFVRSMELSATVWSRIGNPVLSDAYIQILLDSADKKNDRISIMIRSSFLKFIQGDTNAAYKDLTKLKREVGKEDYSLFNAIQSRSLIMMIKLNFLKGRFKICKEIIQVLINNEVKEIDLKNELNLIQVEVEIHLQNYSRALMLIADQLNSLPSSDTYLSIKLNLLKCKIYNLSGNNSKCLVLIIQQIEHGKKVGFRTVVVEGLVLLVSTLNKLGYYQDGYDILQEIMPVVLAVGHGEIVSQAYLDLAQICFQMFKVGKERAVFNKALKFLNLCINGLNQSVSIVMLKDAYMFEKEMAHYINEASLIEHADKGLEQLHERVQVESSHGFILP